MGEYEFSLTSTLPYKDSIIDSLLMRENTGQWNTIFSHIVRSVPSFYRRCRPGLKVH